MRIAVVLDDTSLEAQGAERFTHRTKVRRLTEAPLQECATTKVNPLIHPAAPHDRSETDEDHDDREENITCGFPDKINLQSRRD